MGYNTWYEIDIYLPGDTDTPETYKRTERRHEVAEALKKANTAEFRDEFFIIELLEEGALPRSGAYDDMYSDMLVVSRMFPEYTFLVGGSGENTYDLWEYYFRNGAGSGGQAEIVYPPKPEGW